MKRKKIEPYKNSARILKCLPFSLNPLSTTPENTRVAASHRHRPRPSILVLRLAFVFPALAPLFFNEIKYTAYAHSVGKYVNYIFILSLTESATIGGRIPNTAVKGLNSTFMKPVTS